MRAVYWSYLRLLGISSVLRNPISWIGLPRYVTDNFLNYPGLLFQSLFNLFELNSQYLPPIDMFLFRCMPFIPITCLN